MIKCRRYGKITLNDAVHTKLTPWPEGLDGFIVTKPANRRYLSGFTGSSGLLLLTQQGEKYLVTDFRYIEQATAQSPDYQVLKQEPKLAVTLRELIEKHGLRKIGLEKDFVTLSVYDDFASNLPQAEFLPLVNPFEEKRRLKSPRELESIREAVAVADEAFTEIKQIIRPGLSEKAVAAQLEFIMKKFGAEKNSFDTIVASGERSALPHGLASDKLIQAGELVTLDFGAVFAGYCSDITRTLILGEPDKRQKEIYALVLEAQIAALESIRPGITGTQVDKAAREVIAAAGYGEYFGHGLGHGVGLEIHEEPRFAPRDETVLAPGMVVTVEPGVYLPGWGGVRIEDMIVVSAAGCEILTKAPKDIQEMIIEI